MANFEKLYEKLGRMAVSANTTCQDITGLLQKMGFQIEDCGSAGHKIAKHPAIILIEYPDFNCGHNPGTAVRRQYVSKLFKFVAEHRTVIEEYLK